MINWFQDDYDVVGFLCVIHCQFKLYQYNLKSKYLDKLSSIKIPIKQSQFDW